MKHIPFNRVVWSGSELEYVKQAVRAGHLSGSGPFTRQAESLIFELLGARNLLTTSCTHALELTATLLSDANDERDEVIVPSFTFVTTASAFAINGFKVKFADVLQRDLNINPDSIASLVNDRTRAVCFINYAGRGADINKIRAITEPRGISVIEDNAHGFGGSFKGLKLGTLGDLSTHSFHETKNISCGEGGNIVFNDERFLERGEILREKGTDRSKFLRGQVDKYTWIDLGSSWVPSDILAAVLVGQLERVESINLKRMSIYSMYASSLRKWAEVNNVQLPPEDSDVYHTGHMFFLRFPQLDIRTRFISHLRDHNINAVFHYQALNASPMGQMLGGKIGQCPISELNSNTLVRLPLYESLSDDDAERVIECVQSFDHF